MYRSIFILLLAVLCSFRISMNSDTDKQVMKIADSQLELYMAKIQQGEEDLYGFTPQDDLDACTVGKPFRMVTFTKNFYDRPLEEDYNYIEIKNEWRVPVVLKGQNKAMLTVVGNSGNYNVTGIGSAELAAELQQKSNGVSGDEAYYILHVGPLSANFFVHESDNSFSNAQFVPLLSARAAIPSLSKNINAVYSLADIQKIVKEALAQKK